MAGLNFYTQTLINVNEDPDSKVKKPLFKGTSGLLKVRRDFDFYKDKADYGKVLKVTKAEAADPVLAQATLKVAAGHGLIDLTNALLAEKKVNRLFCRLDMYVGVEGAEPYIYSTPWVAKGMPFWVEFTINKNDTAKVICDNLVKAIKDNHLFLCDKDLIEVTDDDSTVTFDATSEFQRFRKITVSVFDETQDDAEVIAELHPVVGADGHENDVIKLVKRGAEGFGTYSHIVKDLRLPTAANYQWSHIRQAETPIVGAKYDEFIIEYEAPATNEGLGCVGQRMNSVTTHVFWVKKEVVSEFETALQTAGFKPASAEEPYVWAPAAAAASVQTQSVKKP